LTQPQMSTIVKKATNIGLTHHELVLSDNFSTQLVLDLLNCSLSTA